MVSGSPPCSVFVDAGAKVYVCVCVNGEGFLLFLSFQCDQFFFQQ